MKTIWQIHLKFNEEHHFDNKVKYVPNRGDDDPLWNYLISFITKDKKEWTLDEWNSMLRNISSSELTVKEWMDQCKT